MYINTRIVKVQQVMFLNVLVALIQSNAAQAAAGALPLTLYQQALANTGGTIKLQTSGGGAQFIVSQGGGLFMATQQQINEAQLAAAQAQSAGQAASQVSPS